MLVPGQVTGAGHHDHLRLRQQRRRLFSLADRHGAALAENEHRRHSDITEPVGEAVSLMRGD
jgi:hypothetical protein